MVVHTETGHLGYNNARQLTTLFGHSRAWRRMSAIARISETQNARSYHFAGKLFLFSGRLPHQYTR